METIDMMKTMDIEVKIRFDTLIQLDRISEDLGAPSRSDSIRRAIELMDFMIAAIKNGDNVQIKRNKNATRKQASIEQVTIPGLQETI